MRLRVVHQHFHKIVRAVEIQLWGLLAIAVRQLNNTCLTRRYREQARSHRGDWVCEGAGFGQGLAGCGSG